jgi:hypothetical protein
MSHYNDNIRNRVRPDRSMQSEGDGDGGDRDDVDVDDLETKHHSVTFSRRSTDAAMSDNDVEEVSFLPGQSCRPVQMLI